MKRFNEACQKASEQMSHYLGLPKIGPHQYNNTNQMTESLMQLVAEVVSKGAISLGYDDAKHTIEACVMYKGATHLGSITREALHYKPDQVINSCAEILDKIIRQKENEHSEGWGEDAIKHLEEHGLDLESFMKP